MLLVAVRVVLVVAPEAADATNPAMSSIAVVGFLGLGGTRRCIRCCTCGCGWVFTGRAGRYVWSSDRGGSAAGSRRAGGRLGGRLGSRLCGRLGGRLGSRLCGRLGGRLGSRLCGRLGGRLGSRLCGRLGGWLCSRCRTGCAAAAGAECLRGPKRTWDLHAIQPFIGTGAVGFADKTSRNAIDVRVHWINKATGDIHLNHALSDKNDQHRATSLLSLTSSTTRAGGGSFWEENYRRMVCLASAMPKQSKNRLKSGCKRQRGQLLVWLSNRRSSHHKRPGSATWGANLVNFISSHRTLRTRFTEPTFRPEP